MSSRTFDDVKPPEKIGMLTWMPTDELVCAFTPLMITAPLL